MNDTSDITLLGPAAQCKWAKGTRIVEESRRPLVVYRGTGEAEDDRSDRKFWTPDERVARGYAKTSDGDEPHLFSALLKVQKLLDLDNDRLAKRLAGLLGKDFDADDPRWELIDHWDAANAVAQMGYDGVMFNDLNTSNGDQHVTYVSLYPEQVLVLSKEALGAEPSATVTKRAELSL